jgi:hypothetical protein
MLQGKPPQQPASRATAWAMSGLIAVMLGLAGWVWLGDWKLAASGGFAAVILLAIGVVLEDQRRR